ncbi:MAG: hypothetical protein IK093_17080 [Ruminiclostridium sp.]|nr:hypothetical protein [Ruminiclostridium sp.]
MGIKTKVERNEHTIRSQNRVVRDYAECLKSKVISDGHRKAILKEMQLEMKAEQFRKPSLRVYKHNAIRSYDNDVEYGDSSEPEIQPLFNAIQTGGQAVLSVQNKVDNNYIKSKRSTGYIHTAQLRFTGDAKKVVDEARVAETRYNEVLKKQRLKMIVTSETKKQERRKAEVKRHNAEESASTPSTGNTESTDVDKPKKKRRKRRKRKTSVNAELKNQKFTSAKADSDDSVAIEAVETVTAGVATAAQVGGYIRTAVGGTGKAAGKIATTVKNGHIFSRKSSIKDFGHIATAVSSGVANIAKDTGHQLIRTKIDKSTVTDTGTEAIKQGLTEIRYVDNARKAVLNTARTAVKAGKAIKDMPRNTKKQVKRIKKTAKKAKKTVETAGKVIGKILASPVGKYILLALAIIFLILFLIILVVTVVAALISSLFSWLSTEPGEAAVPPETVLSEYVEQIDGYIEGSREEISTIVDGFVCDRISYPPNSEISELNQYGNKEIDPIDPVDVIAILAVLRYRELERQVDITEMQFTYDEIVDVTGKFFNFDYWYSYAHCTCENCQREITVTVSNPGTPEQRVNVNVRYYCDVEHRWLYGEVTNFTLDEVLGGYNFSENEMVLFTAYQEQINLLTGGAA